MITFPNKIIHIEEVDSTNIQAEKLASKEEIVEGTVVSADFQRKWTRFGGQYLEQ